MGYQVSKTEKGYQVKSSMSDEYYHDKDKHLTEDEMKALLIENKFLDFLEDVGKIELEFPDAYSVDGEVKSRGQYASWRVDNNFDEEKFQDLVNDTLKRVGISIDYTKTKDTITIQELQEIGFEEKGHEDDDIFYQIIFKPPFQFGVSTLSGELTDGVFTLWSNEEKYTDINKLEEIIKIFK